MVITPFREHMTKEMCNKLKFNFRGMGYLDLHFVCWEKKNEFEYIPEMHNVYYFRSLRIVSLLTKFHLANLLGTSFTKIIHLFRNTDILFIYN